MGEMMKGCTVSDEPATSTVATPDLATQGESLLHAIWRRYGWIAAVLLACGSGAAWAVPQLIDYGAAKQSEADDRTATRADIEGIKDDVKRLDGKVDGLARDIHRALADRHVVPMPRAAPAGTIE